MASGDQHVKRTFFCRCPSATPCLLAFPGMIQHRSSEDWRRLTRSILNPAAPSRKWGFVRPTELRVSGAWPVSLVTSPCVPAMASRSQVETHFFEYVTLWISGVAPFTRMELVRFCLAPMPLSVVAGFDNEPIGVFPHSLVLGLNARHKEASRKEKSSSVGFRMQLQIQARLSRWEDFLGVVPWGES